MASKKPNALAIVPKNGRKARISGFVTLTPTGVDLADSVEPVGKSTRALTPEEAENVRDCILRLIRRLGTEKAVELHIGVSQQTVGKIKNRQTVPGLYAASKIARADRVPLQAVIGGAPEALYQVLGERRRPEWLVAAVVGLATEMDDRSTEEWRETIRRAEHVLTEVIRKGPRGAQ